MKLPGLQLQHSEIDGHNETEATKVIEEKFLSRSPPPSSSISTLSDALSDPVFFSLSPLATPPCSGYKRIDRHWVTRVHNIVPRYTTRHQSRRRVSRLFNVPCRMSGFPSASHCDTIFILFQIVEYTRAKCAKPPTLGLGYKSTSISLIWRLSFWRGWPVHAINLAAEFELAVGCAPPVSVVVVLLVNACCFPPPSAIHYGRSRSRH